MSVNTSYILNNKLPVFNKMFDYEKSIYFIFAAGKGQYTPVYGQAPNGDVYLLDYTYNEPRWTKKGNLTVNASKGIVTPTGVLVVYCTDKTIRRSTDGGLTFTTVDTLTNSVLPTGIDNNGEIIIYAEYSTSGTSTLRVRKSIDSGLTWTTILTQDRPSVIDHFHTVVYLREHRRWYVTSGDFQAACKWWKSDDNGETLNLIYENDFRLRTCGIAGCVGNSIIWSSDNGSTPFIYVGNKDKPLVDSRIIGTLQGHSLGIAGARNTLMTSYRVEPALDPTGLLGSEIMVSGDSGKSWQTEYRITGDHSHFIGPIYNGHIFIQNDTRGSWVAKPRHLFKHTPIDQGYSELPFTFTMINSLSLRNTTENISTEGLPFDLYNPVLEVSNFLDQPVVIKFVRGDGILQSKEDGSIVQYTVMPSKLVTIDMKNSIPILAKNIKPSVSSSTAPTGGGVTVKIKGNAQRPNDHRVMAFESY